MVFTLGCVAGCSHSTLCVTSASSAPPRFRWTIPHIQKTMESSGLKANVPAETNYLLCQSLALICFEDKLRVCGSVEHEQFFRPGGYHFFTNDAGNNLPST